MDRLNSSAFVVEQIKTLVDKHNLPASLSQDGRKPVDPSASTASTLIVAQPKPVNEFSLREEHKTPLQSASKKDQGEEASARRPVAGEVASRKRTHAQHVQSLAAVSSQVHEEGKVDGDGDATTEKLGTPAKSAQKIFKTSSGKDLREVSGTPNKENTPANHQVRRQTPKNPFLSDPRK